MSGEAQQQAEDWFHVLATHYVEVQALMHLSQLGVLTELFHDAPLTASQLAERCGLREVVLNPLLEYIVAVDELLATDDSGRFVLGPKGDAILRRYGRADSQGRMRFNMFDVRAGAYGPVWAELSGLMRGDLEYGREVKRAGERSEDGLVKVGGRLSLPLGDHLATLGVDTVVEIGLAAQLVHAFHAADRPWRNVGLDRSRRLLERARISATAQRAENIAWLEGDYFQPAQWADDLNERAEKGAFVTLHAHEFLALGKERFLEGLAGLTRHFPGWYVVFVEQPRLPAEHRAEVSPSRWLYSASNVLIHHLIGNGVILSDEGWKELLGEAGCQSVAAPTLGYLDYRAYTTKLWGG